MTILVAVAIFGAVVSVGAFFYFHTFNTSILYIFLGSGFLGVISWVAPLVYASKKSPTKVGYDGENIFYVERKGRTKSIPFNEVEKITSSFDETGYVEIWRSDGTETVLAPGVGGTFGRLLLEKYCEWARWSTGKHARILEEGLGWAKKKRYVVMAPI